MCHPFIAAIIVVLKEGLIWHAELKY